MLSDLEWTNGGVLKSVVFFVTLDATIKAALRNMMAINKSEIDQIISINKRIDWRSSGFEGRAFGNRASAPPYLKKLENRNLIGDLFWRAENAQSRAPC